MSNQKTKFINHPEFPGGPKALTTFIYQQLKYPDLALASGIEGTVLIEYDIDYKGRVVDARVLQGLGHGCDEEALRVVRLLKFDVPANRGLKVLFHKKVNIQFKRPVVQAPPAEAGVTQSLQLTYTLAPTPPVADVEADKPAGETYSYTISW